MILENQLLDALKVDLGITTEAYDERLIWTIRNAADEIRKEGGVIDPENNITDAQTVIMYAGWLWRKRDTGDGMPRMLRYRLNNLVMAGKAK